MARIVIIGGGGHAKVIISILKKLKKYEIVGYTDKHDNGLILGVPYLGDDGILEKINNNRSVQNAAVGIGQIKNTAVRRSIVDILLKIGFYMPAIVSPDSIVNEDVYISDGSVVMDGAIINSGTVIGSYSIINTGVSLDHDCQIGNFVHIAPGCVLSGGTKVEDDTMIGTGASIIHNCRLGRNCIIGAGAVVIQDCIEPGVYAGNPATKKS